MWLLQGTTTIDIQGNLENIPQGESLAGSSMTQLIITLIEGAILVGALILLVYLILGAINWITSGGDKGKVESARNKITQALIGFVILVFVYTLYTFILNVLGVDLGQDAGVSGSSGGSGGGGASTSHWCDYDTIGRTGNDGGAGEYCSNGGSAMVKCFGPGEGVSGEKEGWTWPHNEPCYCISGEELPQYDYSSC